MTPTAMPSPLGHPAPYDSQEEALERYAPVSLAAPPLLDGLLRPKPLADLMAAMKPPPLVATVSAGTAAGSSRKLG